MIRMTTRSESANFIVVGRSMNDFDSIVTLVFWGSTIGQGMSAWLRQEAVVFPPHVHMSSP